MISTGIKIKYLKEGTPKNAMFLVKSKVPYNAVSYNVSYKIMNEKKDRRKKIKLEKIT